MNEVHALKISLFIFLASIAIGVSACVVEPYGGARRYHPYDQRTPQYFQPASGQRGWQP